MSLRYRIASVLRGGRLRPLVSLLTVGSLAAASMAGLITVVRADSPAVTEYKLKAAFIYNFAKFVEWPAEKHENDNSPLVIGVLGPNPFGDELQNALRGRQINGRPISVRQYDSVEAAKAAHLLFVNLNDEAKLRRALKEYGVLTVGQSESFSRSGGIITFTSTDDKLRFDINITAAEQGGLKISAQLQKLAKTVRRGP